MFFSVSLIDMCLYVKPDTVMVIGLVYVYVYLIHDDRTGKAADRAGLIDNN